MLARNYKDINQDKVEMDGAQGVKIRWLIAKDEGAPNFAMREFDVEPGGHSPYHSHDWEHEVFVLEGEGAVVTESGETPISPGSVIYVKPGEMHNFKNTGQSPMRFLCMVPHISGRIYEHNHLVSFFNGKDDFKKRTGYRAISDIDPPPVAFDDTIGIA